MATHEVWNACPQEEFDFRQDGFGRSHAFHLCDPSGIILEIIQPPNDCFLLLCNRDFPHVYFLSFFFNGQYRGAVFP